MNDTTLVRTVISRKTLSCFALFSLLLVAPLYLQGAATGTDGAWLWHADPAWHLKVNYPSQWRLKVPGDGNQLFFITSPGETETDPFWENLGCLARKLPETGFAIFDAEEAIKKTLTEKKYKVIRSVKRQWKGVDSLLFEYSGAAPAEGQTLQIHVLQCMIILDNTLYTLTYTALDSSYAKFLPTVEKMLESLTFDNQPAH